MERIAPGGKFGSQAPPAAATQSQGAAPGGAQELHRHDRLDRSVTGEMLKFL